MGERIPYDELAPQDQVDRISHDEGLGFDDALEVWAERHGYNNETETPAQRAAREWWETTQRGPVSEEVARAERWVIRLEFEAVPDVETAVGQRATAAAAAIVRLLNDGDLWPERVEVRQVGGFVDAATAPKVGER